MKAFQISNRLHTCLTLAVIGFACLATTAKGQTLEWGSEAFSDLQQSNGDPLNNSFIFALGAFANGFVPDQNNTENWHTNWRVFDTAVFNAEMGVFSSSADMNTAGGSSSPTGNSSFNFQGLEAYIWIRNEDNPSPTAQWFLADRDPASWIFPTANPVENCCNNGQPLQWVINDAVAPGIPIVMVSIPEPSASLLVLLAVTTFLLHRRRA